MVTAQYVGLANYFHLCYTIVTFLSVAWRVLLTVFNGL